MTYCELKFQEKLLFAKLQKNIIALEQECNDFRIRKENILKKKRMSFIELTEQNNCSVKITQHKKKIETLKANYDKNIDVLKKVFKDNARTMTLDKNGVYREQI